MIVQLAIIDDNIPAAERSHWLIAGRRKIQDCEPPMGKRDALVFTNPQSATIRPSMADALPHGGGRNAAVTTRP
jgi:hypothetical protein